MFLAKKKNVNDNKNLSLKKIIFFAFSSRDTLLQQFMSDVVFCLCTLLSPTKVFMNFKSYKSSFIYSLCNYS